MQTFHAERFTCFKRYVVALLCVSPYRSTLDHHHHRHFICSNMQVPFQQYQLTMSRTETLSSSTNNCPKPKICWYDKTYIQYIILRWQVSKHTQSTIRHHFILWIVLALYGLRRISTSDWHWISTCGPKWVTKVESVRLQMNCKHSTTYGRITHLLRVEFALYMYYFAWIQWIGAPVRV